MLANLRVQYGASYEPNAFMTASEGAAESMHIRRNATNWALDWVSSR